VIFGSSGILSPFAVLITTIGSAEVLNTVSDQMQPGRKRLKNQIWKNFYHEVHKVSTNILKQRNDRVGEGRGESGRGRVGDKDVGRCLLSFTFVFYLSCAFSSYVF
jgi:hypothetical protein